MLRKLSQRNAKRQMSDYIIYIITMTITVALLLSFNMVIFSEEIAIILKEKSILPFLILMVSILVVFIMSLLVKYIVMFIIKKRSREFGLYMLLGIENKDIAKLFIRENRSIYGGVLIVGLFFGILFYQIIKAVVCWMYAVPFQFSFYVSVKALVLTLLYMWAILFWVSKRTKKVIRQLNVRELLYLDNSLAAEKNEIGSNFFVTIFLMTLGVVGIAIIVLSAFKNLPEGVNTFALVLLIIATYGFFAFMLQYFLSRLKDVKWKYRNNRIFVYRKFTAKMRCMLLLLVGVSVLITLALLFINWGIFFSNKVDERVEAVAFDMALFEDNEYADFSQYVSYLTKNNKLDSSYEYSLYTNFNNDFYQETQKTVHGKFDFSISRTNTDTYMSMKDYLNLRDLLGLPAVTFDENTYILHCTSENVVPLKLYVDKNPLLLLGNTQYQFGGIYCEDFLQQESYGNGNGVLVIVPDNAIATLNFQLRVMGINTNSSLSLSEMSDLTAINTDVKIISKTGIRNQSASMAVYTCLPLFYLAFVFCAIACTILSVQILSYAKKEFRDYQTLNYLGIERKQQERLLKNQLLKLYFLPTIPAIFINALAFPMMTGSVIRDASGTLQMFFIVSGIKQEMVTISLFLAFFVVYYIGTFVIYKKIIFK